MISAQSSHRSVPFDHLRAWAMLAGVVFHAGLAYSPLAHDFFPTADRQNSPIVDAVLWFLHLFRMPVFFVLSGYFAASLIDRRGMGGMVAQRARRLLLPFLLFWPLVTAAMAWSTELAVTQVVHRSPFLEWIHTFVQMPDPPRLPPSTGHLWFLYYLMMLTVLTWAFGQFDWRWLTSWIERQKARRLLILAPCLIAPALYAVPAPHPAPESFLPQFWAMTFYGAFYLAGFWMARRPAGLTIIASSSGGWMWAVAATVAYVGYVTALHGQPSMPPGMLTFEGTTEVNAESVTGHAAIALLGACVSVWMTCACIQLAVHFGGRSVGWVNRIAAASFWIYLIHLPVLFVMQYPMMDTQWGWPGKWLLASVATLALCWGSYELFAWARRVLQRNCPPADTGRFAHDHKPCPRETGQ